MALSLEVTTEPPPDISERSTISLRTRALARWGADAGYDLSAAPRRRPGANGGHRSALQCADLRPRRRPRLDPAPRVRHGIRRDVAGRVYRIPAVRIWPSGNVFRRRRDSFSVHGLAPCLRNNGCWNCGLHRSEKYLRLGQKQWRHGFAISLAA